MAIEPDLWPGRIVPLLDESVSVSDLVSRMFPLSDESHQTPGGRVISVSHPFSTTSLTATRNDGFSLKINHIRLFNGGAPPQAKNTQSPPRRCVAAAACLPAVVKKCFRVGGRVSRYFILRQEALATTPSTDKQSWKWQIYSSDAS